MQLTIEYPEVVLNIKDVKAAIDAGDTVGGLLEKALDTLDNNLAISTAEESGIVMREKLLNIQPSDTATLEDRRLEVLLKWYSVPPYTENALRRRLDTALGADNYVLTVDLDFKLVDCKIELTRKSMMNSIKTMLDDMVPLDYLLNVELRYNQHQLLRSYTHERLNIYTHAGVRGEVMSFAKYRKLQSTEAGSG